MVSSNDEFNECEVLKMSYFDHVSKPARKRTVNKRLPHAYMNLRELSKKEAKRLGPIVYDAWKEFKRNELKKLIEEAKELRKVTHV